MLKFALSQEILVILHCMRSLFLNGRMFLALVYLLNNVRNVDKASQGRSFGFVPAAQQVAGHVETEQGKYEVL